MPPLFTFLWFTDPRARACRLCAQSSALEIHRGRCWDRMRPRWAPVVCPQRANPAQGNPNSMPQIRARSKSAAERSGAPGFYRGSCGDSAAVRPWFCRAGAKIRVDRALVTEWTRAWAPARV